MPFSSRQLLSSLTGIAVLAATVAIPATAPLAAEALNAQPIAAELLPAAALPATVQALGDASLRLGADVSPALLDDAVVTVSDDAEVAAADDGDRAGARAAALDEETICLAKAVRHEAGNQPREGQLAVAQVIMNRLRSGRFAGSICGVVNQQGQFFSTAAYNPARDTPAWATAVAVSREAISGEADEVAPGALFFQAAYAAPTGFFRTRQRVAALGGHVFYR